MRQWTTQLPDLTILPAFVTVYMTHYDVMASIGYINVRPGTSWPAFTEAERVSLAFLRHEREAVEPAPGVKARGLTAAVSAAGE